ncbi:Intermembrane phospholipid transport system lipoprotein MlaA [Pseudoalteromonas holothuriae]|uniref:Intermembrane phospholipid transport system lipoprotein MlaA n=1 Tax=Pseudoalteromonas holothuriae TaxID=2963714 RepID=A0A9W4QWQ6_9GAMM|nr:MULTISPECIES: VacJ family lipoprotein [unclassified Pseudoalteromonas]CAH9054503.1 Intermembrane phospholipid transport system lipoprotein MlaA [Pseudoalteromonas sp. CIP111951]CAH9057184.1 Intermembrane phospholipid transport system lipoprotein MlaA [Pseudoalteromonas sp. CIP111854]
MFKPFLAAFAAVVICGCSSIPIEKQDDRDPLQTLNRPIYDFNMDVIDSYILRPVTVGYVAITPQPVRTGLVNFTTNLTTPTDAINAALQGKPESLGINTARFLINSTVGVLGLFDVASSLGLKHHDEDFGQTLGVWGVGDGAYLMLPGMGPSTLRNLTGDVVDNVVLPEIALTTPQTIAVFAFKAIETRAQLMAQEKLLHESLDPYIFVKDVYFQRQLYELYDGNPPIKEEPEDFDEDFLENL